MRKTRTKKAYEAPKLLNGECRFCHTVKTTVQFWHLWWCPMFKFVRINF